MPEQTPDNRIADLETRLKKLENLLATHQHNNQDGTIQLRKTLQLDPDQRLIVGNTILRSTLDTDLSSSFFDVGAGDEFIGIWETGPEIQNPNIIKLPNQKVYSVGLPFDTARRSVLYAKAPPIISSFESSVGTIDVTSGTSTVTIDNYSFTNNELVDCYVVIFDASGEFSEIQPIQSNTSNVITIYSTFTTTVTGGSFEIFSAPYLGNIIYPWRQLAVAGEDTTGGILFSAGNESLATTLYTLNYDLIFNNNGGQVNLTAGQGISDSFTTVDGKTVTVTNGIVTNIV